MRLIGSGCVRLRLLEHELQLQLHEYERQFPPMLIEIAQTLPAWQKITNKTGA